MSKYEILLQVCESGSISKAAQELNYTQSAVSQAVRSFEKEIGAPLFRRSRHGMELLPDTEEILQALQIICREEDHIRRAARGLTSLDQGEIRVGTIQSISYHWLPDLLKAFSRNYPNIHFELTVDGFNSLKEKIQANQLDCIFVSRYSVPGLPFLALDEDELMLAMPEDHPLSRKTAVSLSDLDGEDFILSSDGLDYEAGQILGSSHIRPRIRYQLNEDFATLKMVEQGFGVTILPRLLLTGAPFAVCARPFRERYFRTLGVAWAGDVSPGGATAKFLEYVKTEQQAVCYDSFKDIELSAHDWRTPKRR